MARVVFGVPLYNGARHLREAVETLLAQGGDELALVLVDDASSDDTARIAAGYAEADPRVSFHRTPQRLGLVGAWRLALETALAEHPEAEYFAWGSDHDAWHPRWLSALAGALDRDPRAVLAYPRSVRMGEHGEQLRPQPPWRFDTAGVSDPRDRLRRFSRDGVAGDMVYGLFRAAPLATRGFPRALSPDRLLLAELTVVGEFHQVPEILWHRRYVAPVSARRQRRTLFVGRPPLSSRAPWPITHFALLAGRLVFAGAPDASVGRLRGLRLAAGYLGATVWRRAVKHAMRPVGVASHLLRRALAAVPPRGA